MRKKFDDFNKKSSTKDGLQNFCRECNSKVTRKHYTENKINRRKVIYAAKAERRDKARKFIIEKLQTGCVSCQEKDPIVLDFDHISGKKKYNLSSMVREGMSIIKIEDELSKCQVLCSNCHRRKTAQEGNWYKLFIGD